MLSSFLIFHGKNVRLLLPSDNFVLGQKEKTLAKVTAEVHSLLLKMVIRNLYSLNYLEYMSVPFQVLAAIFDDLVRSVSNSQVKRNDMFCAKGKGMTF